MTVPTTALVLGGTGFVGPHVVAAAVERGHRVTVFNRGNRRERVPDGVEVIVGDRELGRLDALRGRGFDIVVDVPTMRPAWVTDIAAALGAVGRYVFVSTISVYDLTGQDAGTEAAPRLAYAGDAAAVTEEEFRANVAELYGPLKAAAEDAAVARFGDRATIVRPGLIVGPGDPSDRFTYWPVRVARGGEVLAPGTPSDPVQFVDVRDLADWTIAMVEKGKAGVFNATGPKGPLGIGTMLAACREASASDASFTWADEKTLEELKIAPWSDMPVWLPTTGDTAGANLVSAARAIAEGLTFRPVLATAKDTLAWWKTLPEERRARLKAGLTPEREAAALKAIREKKAKG